MNKFTEFLKSIQDDKNSMLLESIHKGFEAIIESPDTVILPDSVNSLTHEDSEALPFIYLDETDKLLFDKSLSGQMHLDLLYKVMKDTPYYKRMEPEFKTDQNFKASVLNRIKAELKLVNDTGNWAGFLGRVWVRHKVMSFWKYPPESMLKGKIIPKLKENGINIDSSWKIEVYKKESSNTVLIPIDDYRGKYLPDEAEQKELDKMREWHTMDPIEKQKYKKNNTPTPTKEVDSDGKSMAELNYLRKELAGD
jgi:hypothetical protein